MPLGTVYLCLPVANNVFIVRGPAFARRSGLNLRCFNWYESGGYGFNSDKNRPPCDSDSVMQSETRKENAMTFV